MEDQTHRYRQIRNILKQFVTDVPGELDRPMPGTVLQAAHTYLHAHCAECGATLENHDYVEIHALELVRVGTSMESDPAHSPICSNCYELRRAALQRFAPIDDLEQG